MLESVKGAIEIKNHNMVGIGGHPKPSLPHHAVIFPSRALRIVYLIKETHTNAKEGTDTEGDAQSSWY